MPYNRDWLCLRCGTMRRAPGPVPGQENAGPACCETKMVAMEYEGAVAAKQLTPSKRVTWYHAGAHFAKRGGKRKWTPVFDKKRCSGSHPGR